MPVASAVSSSQPIIPASQPTPDSGITSSIPSIGRLGEYTIQQLQPTQPPTQLKKALDERAQRKQHINQLTHQHQVAINHLSNGRWEISGGLYVKPLQFKSFHSLQQFLKKDTTDQQRSKANQIAQQWGVTISRSSNPDYPWKITGDALEQTFRFKSLDNMSQALEQGYLRRTAKHMAAAERLMRGRDVHNVTSLTKMDTGPVLVIDGGDDLAVSLENSGLPRSLVLAVQSTALYPAFIGVVHKGWQGASDEYGEAREEYQELIESQQAVKDEIRSLVTEELALKEQVLNTSDNTEEQQQLRDLLFSHHQFKTTLLASVEPLLKAGGAGDQQAQDAGQLKDTINQLNTLKAQLADHNQTVKAQLANNQASPELQLLLTKLESSQLFDPTSPECHELIQQLAEYKANQDDKLAKFADAHIAAAFTESGLSGMYWGMVSFEARATTELLLGETTLPFSSVLSQMGDTFNVIGQAQMVIAGLTKAGLGISEIKSLNEWLDQIKNTDALKKPELAEVKAIVDQFYRHQRNITIGETIGNSVLTLGQLGMILGGPFGTGVSAVLYAGVGATIGGVAMSQAAAQYSNKVFNVSEEKSKAEKDIEQWTTPNASPLEIIQQRIGKLYQLSQEQATPKVWLSIYQALAKNPQADAFTVIAEVSKKYQPYGSDHSGHYRQLYKQALDIIKGDYVNSIGVIETARQLLQKEVQQKQSTAFSAFVSQHITALQQGEVLTPTAAAQQSTLANQINQLFNFAEQQGFAKEFERRIVKRLVNQNGYMGNKENKVDPGPYISQIAANKSKRPWQIPNPIAPVVNLGRLVKQLIKPKASPTLLSGTLSIPMNWGKKDTTVYVFNREKFLEDLQTLKPESPAGKHLHRLCQTIFTEQMANEAKHWITKQANKVYIASGKDNMHVFEETMRHIGKQVLRGNVLRPIVHGVPEQVKLADLIAQLKEGKTV